MSFKATYVWLDGTKPTAQIRSKTKILKDGQKLPIWGFDGSSTNQAPGEDSDCVLKPVFARPDTSGGFRDRSRDKIVLCEVYNTDGTPHESNTRRKCVETYEDYKFFEPWFGMEQEYTFLSSNGDPLGFLKGRNAKNGDSVLSQGPYYCSVGHGLAVGREIVEEHLEACLKAGLKISGINAEVMPGQWEFQVGPLSPVAVSDHLWVARWLLQKIAEKHDVIVSFEGKPSQGDWNGAGCHTNFSTFSMRESYDSCVQACVALGERREIHVQNYGHGIEERLTGDHETCSYKEYKFGVSDRGASVRIPWQVKKNNKGYIEDRRPNANCDPYVVSNLVTETVCSQERINTLN